MYRLGKSTVVEPLVNRWAAWAHLVPPVASSLHLQHYQLNLLQSYLDDPKFHVQACRDRKLRSGPFVDIPVERAPEVAALLASTRAQMADNLELATSLMEFHKLIVKEATGHSLEPYYEQLPLPLQGYVELIYDYYNRPIVRVFESLLYESNYYHNELQSLRLFRHTNDDARPFIMSTPRLPAEGQVDWEIPFDSSQLDEFFKLDGEARPLGLIRELLGLPTGREKELLPLLTQQPAPARAEWNEPTVRVRYIGHACVLVEWKGVAILTDPYIGAVPAEGGLERFTYEDLPERIDYVLITHNHHDHFCLETLLRLRRRIGCLVVPKSSGVFYGDMSLKLLAEKVGFKNVVELDSLGSIPLPGGEIVAIPFLGEHADLPHSKTAFVVRAGSEQILFGADSDCLDRRMYEHVRRILGPVQTIFLGMECVGAPLSWSAGAFLPAKPERSQDQSRRFKGCDSSRALEILDALGSERIFIYAMGMEPWLEHLLGLGYTEDSVQILESSKLLINTRDRGFAVTERLYGKREIHFSELPAGQTPTPRRSSTPVEEQVPAAATVRESREELEGEFIFD
jgi:L-ascorbate metabolism protein UlaG (beta-lactamase superfamily)